LVLRNRDLSGYAFFIYADIVWQACSVIPIERSMLKTVENEGFPFLDKVCPEIKIFYLTVSRYCLILYKEAETCNCGAIGAPGGQVFSFFIQNGETLKQMCIALSYSASS